jgi:hypothetical protein
MRTIIALLFCLLLGIMLKVQGFSALLWLPLGFVISLYATAQIALPLMLGMPHAIRLVAKRQMRAGVFFRLLVVPAIWAGVVFGGLFLLGYFWPSVATFIEANNALNVGSWLGIIAIMLSPLSRKSRSDFREDFNRSYSRFYIARPPPHRMNCTIVKQLPNHCVPACLESVAKDSGITSATQEDIVRQFPSVFPNGVLNDVNKSPNLEDVVRALGLADGICRIRFQGIENLAELHRENEILLMWEEPAKHCVRVFGCDLGSQLARVMDPAQDELQTYDVAQLNSLARDLVFFKRRQI